MRSRRPPSGKSTCIHSHAFCRHSSDGTRCSRPRDHRPGRASTPAGITAQVCEELVARFEPSAALAARVRANRHGAARRRVRSRHRDRPSLGFLHTLLAAFLQLVDHGAGSERHRLNPSEIAGWWTETNAAQQQCQQRRQQQRRQQHLAVPAAAAAAAAAAGSGGSGGSSSKTGHSLRPELARAAVKLPVQPVVDQQHALRTEQAAGTERRPP